MGQLGLKQAMYWEKTEGGRVHCLLCPHGCRIADSEVGLCRVRQNTDGVLRTLNYERVSSVHWDPIEKKPLFHFHPGSQILSLGTVGCNLACAFCQNWSISQASCGTQRMSSEEAVNLAKSRPGNLGIAYTYNEPFIWYEFVLETAKLIREQGMKNVLVTNGYVNEEPLREILPYIDAMNVDIKSMGKDFYRELCRGRPEPPRRTVEIACEAGCLVEVTNLVIPNWNDSESDLTSLVDWVASVGRDVPLHFSRYHPDHQLTEPPTPTETLLRARQLALAKLDYVYIGNVWDVDGENTVCPQCKKTVVSRRGFEVSKVAVKDGRCRSCGGTVKIIGL
jgi:pyruvate formate lyase activating enzyme